MLYENKKENAGGKPAVSFPDAAARRGYETEEEPGDFFAEAPDGKESAVPEPDMP